MALPVVLGHLTLVDRHATPALVAGRDHHPGAGGLELVVEVAGDVERSFDCGLGGDDVGQELLERTQVSRRIARTRPAKLADGPSDERVRAFRRLSRSAQRSPGRVRFSHLSRPRRRRPRAALLVPRHQIARERLWQDFLGSRLSDRQFLPMAPRRPRDVQQRTDASHVAARDAELLADLRHRLRPDQGMEFLASDHAGVIAESFSLDSLSRGRAPCMLFM